MAVAIAVVLHRRGSDELARVALPAAVLAVPIAAFAVIPILDGVESAREVRTVCRIASPAETRPAACRPKGLEPGDYALLPGALRTPAGERLELGDQPQGFVDQTRVTSTGAQVVGWSGDRDARRPAAAVLLFVGDRYLGAVAPTVSRPDIAKLFGTDEARRSGFDVRVPEAAGKLTVIGLSDGRAHELTFDCSQPRDFGC